MYIGSQNTYIMETLPSFISEHIAKFEKHKISLKKGEHLCKAGDLFPYIALVREGYLRTYQIDYEGNDITLQFYEPEGYCSSYYGFYTQSPALEFIESITDSIVLLISYEDLMQAFAQDEAVNTFGRKLIEQICLEKDFRISKMLQSNATERYLWFMEKYGALVNIVQLRHIASFLGIKAETLSRVRKTISV